VQVEDYRQVMAAVGTYWPQLIVDDNQTLAMRQQLEEFPVELVGPRRLGPAGPGRGNPSHSRCRAPSAATSPPAGTALGRHAAGRLFSFPLSLARPGGNSSIRTVVHGAQAAP
jgi:hypothetical protein